MNIWEASEKEPEVIRTHVLSQAPFNVDQVCGVREGFCQAPKQNWIAEVSQLTQPFLLLLNKGFSKIFFCYRLL